VGHTIAKRFAFSAGHHLPGLPPGHKCGRPHGHNYTVELVLTSDNLIGPGFVTDFTDLAPMKRYIDETFDHRVLNDVLTEPSTSERLAEHFARWAVEHLEPVLPCRVVRVRVSETDSTWAEFAVDRPA
jgi:6-pyruvoyltetrahydropterin/6-carboxytetrahydropterin synthase